jgi:hypothetical protein
LPSPRRKGFPCRADGETQADASGRTTRRTGPPSPPGQGDGSGAARTVGVDRFPSLGAVGWLSCHRPRSPCRGPCMFAWAAGKVNDAPSGDRAGITVGGVEDASDGGTLRWTQQVGCVRQARAAAGAGDAPSEGQGPGGMRESSGGRARPACGRWRPMPLPPGREHARLGSIMTRRKDDGNPGSTSTPSTHGSDPGDRARSPTPSRRRPRAIAVRSQRQSRPSRAVTTQAKDRVQAPPSW